RIEVGGVSFPIVAVMREGIEGIHDDQAVDMWIPLRRDLLDRQERVARNFWVFGKIRAGAVATGLQMSAFTGRTPERAAGLTGVGTVLRAASTCVFLVACANVALFLIGRATARAHETSLRIALGAGRWVIVRGVLADSIAISLAGSLLGGVLAVWTLKIVPAFLFEEDAQRLVFVSDFGSIAGPALACAGITILCGLLPLLAIPFDRPEMVLRREAAGPSRIIQNLRSGLVIAQMASCCLLAISTGFLTEGLRAAFRAGGKGSSGSPILATVQTDQNTGFGYFRAIEAEARSVLGTSGMAWTNHLPGSFPATQSFRIEPRQMPMRDVTLDVDAFTPAKYGLFRMPLKAGHMFGFEPAGCAAAVVNVEAARLLFANESPGRVVRDTAGVPVEILGVVEEAAGAKSGPTMYVYHDPERAGPTPARISGAHFRAPAAAVRLESGELETQIVSPDYFRVMGISLVDGELFPSGGCRVGVVNEEAAELYFRGDANGASVIDDVGHRTLITGKVHTPPLGTFQRRVEPAIYFPMAQDFAPGMTMTLIANARAVNEPMLADMRRQLGAVTGGGAAPPVIRTLETLLGQTALAPLRIASVIIGASAVTAILLGILGLYGTLDDSMRRRGRELAVRIALGARRRHIFVQVLREGLLLAAMGSLAGVIAAVALTRLLLRIIPGGGLPAVWVWLAGPCVLAGTVMLSSLLPARRASLVNPLRLMRGDE
ncbi:MAG TPA: FtsX-like permease family protein, partial [Bryobacteraceae bacterium]